MQLHERVWGLDGAKGAVIIVHGLAEHAGRYEYVAGKLNEAGYEVHARDLRGHGRSPGFPGNMGGELQPLIDDIVSHAGEVAQRHDSLFLLAHSMGTLLTLPAVAAMPAENLTGLVLSGLATVPGPATLKSLTEGGVVPPEEISRDPEIVKAYAEDPLVFYDQIPQQLILMGGEAIGRAMEAIALVTVPTLFLHGLADTICDVSGSQAAHTQMVTTDKTLLVYEGLYHEVLNEPERDKVIGDVVAWMDERLR